MRAIGKNFSLGNRMREIRKTELLAFLGVAVILVTGASYAMDSLPLVGTQSSDLVAEYRFDNGAGTTAYDSAGSNDGAINGATWTEGVEGKALKFDGSSRISVSHEDSFQPVNGFTASVWMKPGNVPPSGSIGVIGNSDYQNGGFTLGLRGGDYVASLNDGSSEYLNYGPQADERWVNLVVSFDGSTSKLYLNGQEVASQTADMTRNSNSFQIGSSTQGGWGNFQGKVDNVKILSEDLDAEQVRSLYRSGAWSMGSESSINYNFKEGFEKYGRGSIIDGENGWNYGGPCNSGSCEVESRSESGQQGLYQVAGDGDMYQQSLTRTFDKPLRGKITVEGEYWEKSSPNWDGNFWVQACDGTNLAGIGTENPEFEADVLGSEAHLSNPGATYQEWTNVKMDLDTRTGQVNFSWDQDNTGASDTHTDNFGTGYEICKFGVGPGGRWYIDDISIRQESSKVLDIGFDKQNSTHVFDTSGENNHGLSTGASQKPANMCKNGRCYGFDTGDNLNVSNSPELNPKNAATVMAWVRSPQLSEDDWQGIVMKNWDAQYQIRADGDSDGLQVAFYDESGNFHGATGGSLKDNKWHHIAGVYDGEYVRGYIDGKETLKSQEGDFNLIQTESPLTIGTNKAGGDEFVGNIDDIKVFDRALIQSEIAEAADLESKGAVLDMRFDSDGGDHLEDYSNRNNHGSLPSDTEEANRVKGVKGNALNTRGTIPDSNSLDPRKDYSISFWFKPGSWSGSNFEGTIFRKTGAGSGRPYWVYGGSPGNKLQWEMRPNNGDYYSLDSKKTNWNQDEWYHITLRYYDNQTWEMWVDGELDVTDTESIPVSKADGSLDMVYGDFNGSLDNLKIYPYKISKKKIRKLHDRGVSGFKNLETDQQLGLQKGLVLEQSFDRVETCGQSDTVSCPSGMSGKIAVDESGEGNHGELVNGLAQKNSAECKVGKCLEFDGSDDTVEVSYDNSLNFTDQITVAGWVKPKNPNSGSNVDQNKVMFKSDTFNFQPGGPDNLDNEVRFEVHTGSWNGCIKENVVEYGEWNHFTLRYDGSEMSIYENGEEVKSCSQTGNITGPDSPLDISLSGQPYHGSADQLRVYNRTLSEKEVWNLYTNGRDRDNGMAGPVAEYRFDATPRVCILNQGSLSNGGWGAPTDSELKGLLVSEGWETDYVKVGEITEDGWKDCEVIVFPDGEHYPAFDKSQDFCNSVNGEGSENDVYAEMKEFMRNGGMWIGSWGAGLYYPNAWDGSNWQRYHNSCSQFTGDSLYDRGGSAKCSDLGYSCHSGGYYNYTNINQSVTPALSGTITSAPSGERWASNLDVNMLQAYDGSSPVSGKYAGIEGVGRGWYVHMGENSLFDPSRHSNADEAWNNLLTWYAGDGEQRFWDSEGDYNGEISGDDNAPVYTSGEREGVLKFDGDNDKINIGKKDALNLKDRGLTVSYWQKWDEGTGLSSNHLIMGKRSNFNIDSPGWGLDAYSYNNPELIRARISDGTGQQGVSFSLDKVDGKWSHIALSIDPNDNMQIFLNGKEMDSEQISLTGSFENNRKMMLGDIEYSGGGSDRLFNGSMDDVRIYPYPMTQEEINGIMNSGGVSVG